jgi:RNA polymerase sigma-70 factor (ECF subfamily)
LRIVLRLAFAGNRIAGVEAIADAERIAGMETEVLDR